MCVPYTVPKESIRFKISLHFIMHKLKDIYKEHARNFTQMLETLSIGRIDFESIQFLKKLLSLLYMKLVTLYEHKE